MLDGKESACQCRRCGFDPWVGRSPGEGMTTHSSILAGEIPRTEDPGRGWGGQEWQGVRYVWLSD